MPEPAVSPLRSLLPEFTSEGGEKFRTATGELARFPVNSPQRQLAIVVDGVVTSAPAVAAGVAGVFCEVHPDPPAALCDADSQVTPAQMEAVLKQLLAIDAARRTETGNEARALPTPGEEL